MPTHKGYVANRKTRPDLATDLHPDIFEAGEPTRPKGSGRPAQEGDKDAGSSHRFAPWVPVEWQDNLSKDWFCLASGKMGGIDTQGNIVPAGLRVLVENAGATSDTFITYTTNDVDAITMNITTGAAVAAATSYTIAQVNTALIARGLVAPGGTLSDFLQPTVGAVLQTVYSPFSLGDATAPWKLKFTNYLLQKGIQFTTHSQMKVPVVPSAEADFESDAAVTDTNLVFASGNTFTRTRARGVARYSAASSTGTFIAVALPHRNIAKNTSRTPIGCDDDTVLLRERKLDMGRYITIEEAIAAVLDTLVQAGDWFLDYDAGVLFLYSSDGATVTGAEDVFTYHHYGVAPSVLSKYMCVEGEVLPGDYVKVTEASNFTKWVSGTDDEALKVGRCYGLVREPNGLIQHVRTPSGIQGSGTEGYTRNITMTGASDTLAKIVMLCR